MYHSLLIYAVCPDFPSPPLPSVNSVSILSETPNPLLSISSVRPPLPKRANITAVNNAIKNYKKILDIGVLVK